MPRDTFPRKDPWSVGLDCADCAHFAAPPRWPDTERVSRCSLHDLSLAVELNRKGFKQGEWFCSDFEDAGHTLQQGSLGRLFHATPPPCVPRAALGKLDEIRHELRADALYGFSGEGRDLKEVPFVELTRDRD
jgi:hypothetical protein